MFSGNFGVPELLVLAVIVIGIFVVRPLWRLLWAVIHKLEK